MKYINLTERVVRLNDGREFFPSGIVAKVGVQFNATQHRFIPEEYADEKIDLYNINKHVLDLPPEDTTGTITYIVDIDVLEALYPERMGDILSPAYGHPDCVFENGEIFSVPGFVW